MAPQNSTSGDGTHRSVRFSEARASSRTPSAGSHIPEEVFAVGSGNAKQSKRAVISVRCPLYRAESSIIHLVTLFCSQAKDAAEIYTIKATANGKQPSAANISKRYGITAKAIRDIWNHRKWARISDPQSACKMRA